MADEFSREIHRIDADLVVAVNRRANARADVARAQGRIVTETKRIHALIDERCRSRATQQRQVLEVAADALARAVDGDG